MAPAVVYWDASAILSVLIADAHSGQATTVAGTAATHLLSTLAQAEVVAVIGRLEREGRVPPALADVARDSLRRGPWRRLALLPDWTSIDALGIGLPLRGADLWHLATAVTLSREVPEVRLLSFDQRLAAAADGLGLGM